MHYKNGRLAQEGDHVIAPIWRAGKIQPTAAVLNGLTPTSTSCNATATFVQPGTVEKACVTIGQCVHVEDAIAAFDNQNTAPAAPPVNNANVAEGSEKFSEPQPASN